MHHLYRLTAIPHFCDKGGNPFGMTKDTLVSWLAFYSDEKLKEVEHVFYKREGHNYASLDIHKVTPQNVAERLAQYFLSKGDYKTDSEKMAQRSLEAYGDMLDNPRQYIRQFLEANIEIEPLEPFVSDQRLLSDTCVDWDFVEETLDAFASLIRNCYEPYTPLSLVIDENEEEIESYNTVYSEDGMLVTRDRLVNSDMVEMREGEDGQEHPHCYLTFSDFLSEYSDFIYEADLEGFLSEYEDEVRYRKSLGYDLGSASDFIQRWFSSYTRMHLSDFPQEWRDAINDAHAIAAA